MIYQMRTKLMVLNFAMEWDSLVCIVYTPKIAMASSGDLVGPEVHSYSCVVIELRE